MKILLGCLCFFLLCADLWFLQRWGAALFLYSELKEQSEGTIENIYIKELGPSKYVLGIDFSYIYNGEVFHNQGTLGSLYPNPWAARGAQEKIRSQLQQKIWINPKKPEKSFLQKTFPIKQTVSSIVLLGITFYFALLLFYARKKYV